MNQISSETAEFKEFLEWFCSLEEIPLQTRHDFLAHIAKVGYMDQKSLDFVTKTLDTLETKFDNQYKEYKNIADLLKNINAQESNKKTSFKEAIIKDAEEYMMSLAENFKNDYREYQQHETKKEETTEKQSDQDEVDAIKASLGKNSM